MEHLPTLAADAANPACRGSNSQRNQGYECREAHGDERALGDIFPHGGEIEGLVGPEVSEEVEADVKESEETKHAAKADKIREIEEFAEGGDAKRENKKTQSPVAGGVLDEFDGIRAEFALNGAPDQFAKGYQAKKKDCDFGPFADEECAHAEGLP
jgi:hypothetical protein